MGLNLDWGIASIILACLVFYARLMMAQRRRARAAESQGKERVSGRKKGSRKKSSGPVEKPVFGAFSRKKRDWIVGGVGYAFVMLGVLLRMGYLQSETWGPMWWFPVSLGIIGFSWFFN
ncbi:MAG TPA: hypothetical protein VFF68_04565 [Anaerolineaceae bacterium]|nr:hypothetical protein [Anaerolineaceae bacterium]